ncbi:MAG: cytochrome oxidase assembly protein [Planctomycetota bacterium]|nr:MAG: cytochrome oxidase assembly protein [Planctomycetota bacterium]
MTSRSLNWTHLVACLLVGVTAVLLSFGALVTTYEAAMAVPDWPATYGHNMFLFPWAEWLYGPWDLFLEHGHRLLGAAAGMVTLVLAAVSWRSDIRPAVRWLALAAVGLVILQGALGGARVLLDDKTIAKVHACTGPLFFAVAVAIATLSRRPAAAAAGSLARLPVALLVAAYLQLVAGAQLRHLDATVDPSTFHTLVGLHILGAVAVTVLSVVSAVVVSENGSPAARGWSRGIVVLVAVQMLLGAGAWMANWGLPSGLLPESWQWSEPLRARSLGNAAVVTGHVVLGMLILAATVVLAIEAGAIGGAQAGREAGDGLASGRVFA